METTLEIPLDELIKTLPGYDPYADCEGYYFDEESAHNAINWIESYCTFTKGEWSGKPLILEDWQKAMVANLFGWKSKTENVRRFREVFLYVPRKNGKTETMGAIANYVLFCDGEEGAEIYSAAAEADQAKIVWNVSAKMIRAYKALLDRTKLYTKSIVHPKTESFYKPITADAKTKHGFNTHCALIDELHAQANEELVDVIETSMGARQQPLLIYMTTADFDKPSICNKIHDRACKIRDGDYKDPNFLPIIYEALKDKDDWKDPETWRRVNPNYGVSLKENYFERKFQKAMNEPSFENTFKRLHLNMKTEQANRWLKMEDWDNSCQKFNRAEMLQKLKGHRCYAGLDLSSTIDTTALVLLFPDDDFVCIPWVWIPADTAAKKEKDDKVPYRMWKSQGFIETTTGNRIDYAFIEKKILELDKDYKFAGVAFDPYNATQLSINLHETHGLPMFRHQQGYLSMNEPSKRLEADIAKQIVNHGHNPVLRWMAGNVAIKEDPAGNIKPDKMASFEKIDGIVALIMAYGCFLQDEGEKISPYQNKDLSFISFDD